METVSTRITWERDPRYLSDDDLFILTGWRNKRRQATQLLKMGIPFALTICSDPLVPVAAIEVSLAAGRREAKETQERLDSIRRMHEMEATLRRR